MNKIKSRKGETLIETLSAILIMLLVVLFLTTSIVSAQKMNRKVREADTSFHYSADSQEDGTVTVKIGNSEHSFSVKYYTDNDYIYYI